VLGPHAAQHRGQVVPVNVGDEMEVQPRVDKGIQRGHHHLRPQVGAANADIDHIVDVAAGQATGRGTDALDVVQHGAQGVMDEITVRRQATRCAQGGVQRRTVFGLVDVLARQQGVAPGFDAALAGQVQQMAGGGHIPMGTRKVSVDVRRIEAETRHALRILAKQFAQVQVAALGFEVPLQGQPGHRLIAAEKAHAHLNDQRCASMSASSLAASSANRRMPSASFSLPMASSLRA
jgi:hypothetical protein